MSHRTASVAVHFPELLVALVLLGTVNGAASAPAISLCKDAQGRPIATDPTNPSCHKPPPTEDERLKADEIKRRLWQEYRECKAKERADATLVARYPNKARHDSAREAALAELEGAARRSRARLEQLLVERKKLLDEAEFYPSGNLPPKLRRDIEANSALIEAQKQAMANQQDELARKNAFYDGELAILKTLWSPASSGRARCVQPAE